MFKRVSMCWICICENLFLKIKLISNNCFGKGFVLEELIQSTREQCPGRFFDAMGFARERSLSVMEAGFSIIEAVFLSLKNILGKKSFNM